MLKKLHVNTKNIMGLVFLTIPFSYYSIIGVRVILISAFLVFVACLINGVSLRKSPDFFLFILNVIFVFFLSILSGNNNEFLAAFFFFTLMYWPDFVGNFNVNKEVVSKYIRLYVYSAVFCALGVIVQSYLYKTIGLELGKIDTYLNRTGFGFLWLDYSFLSLFLTSSIPLLFREKIKYKYIISLLLIVGSITTTARTGLFSLVLAMLICSMVGFSYNLFRSKAKKLDFIIVLLSILLIVSIVVLWQSYSDRELTLNGSGRFEGYYDALMIFLTSPYIGYSFDIVEYRELYGAVPHNVFLYVMVFGGLLGIFLFIFWVVFLTIRVVKCDYFLKLSLLTVFIGLQFIPSYYSGYFLAILVSIAILNLKVDTT